MVISVSIAIINKVALLPDVDHNNELLVGSSTRMVGFDPAYLQSKFADVLATPMDAASKADVIIQKCRERDYWRRYTKEY